MIASLCKVNPFDDEVIRKIADYANKTTNPNLISYYQNIRTSFTEDEYKQLKMQDNYYNETHLLIEEDEITGAAFIEGYKDEKKYSISFSTLPNKKDKNQELLSLATSYLIDELNADFIGITLRNQDDKLIRFAINNSYEIIDKSKEHTELIREESYKK